MKYSEHLFAFCLWWAVIGFSIWFGGTVFSMTVIVPMWSYDLPESARSFFGETIFNQSIYNFFGPPWMLARNIPLIIALVLGWNTRLRPMLLLSSFILVIAIIITILYVYPMNYQLMIRAGEDLSNSDLTALARRWIWVDRVRFAFMTIAFISLLKAFKFRFDPDREIFQTENH